MKLIRMLCIGALTFVVLPSATIVFFDWEHGLRSVIAFLPLATVILGAAIIFSLMNKDGIIRLFVLALLSFFYLLLALALLYLAYTGHRFDPRFLLDSYRDVVPTAYALFGVTKISIVLLVSVVLVYAIYRYFSIIGRVVGTSRIGISSGLATFLASAAMAISIPQIGVVVAGYDIRSPALLSATPVFFPRYEQPSAVSGDNVFIVQLESLNALALNGRAVVDGREYPGDFMPIFRRIASDGVLFPFFWGNGIQTNRAQEAILCSSANNFRHSLLSKPGAVPSVCLPAYLRRAGYATLFFHGQKLTFANTGSFMKHIGFDETHDWSIAEKTATRFPMGVDDCDLYNGVFDYLDRNEHKKSKLFVYIAVSAHHINFDLQEQYASLARFSPPSTFIEQYLNSAQSQDYCLSKMYERFKEYAPNSHLIIVGDHSYPVGINGSIFNEYGASTDNFLTSLAYIPPRRQGNYNRGTTIEDLSYGQTDIMPTVLQLLSGTSYKNSFASLLRTDLVDVMPHEACFQLVQPYVGGYVSIVHEGKKYTYSAKRKTVSVADLTEDLLERNSEEIDENLSLDEFLDRYQCARYRQSGE